MQVLEAGPDKYLLLEVEPEAVANIARQAGFAIKIEDADRVMALELLASERFSPLLLFDAADPGNLGWFSRCQFYVDGKCDRNGRTIPNAIRVQIMKELPSNFRMPNRQPINEQVVYAVLFNLLNALMDTGVGVCGGPTVRPLAGRTENIGPKN